MAVDLVDISSAVRDPDTNTLKADAKSAQVGDTEDDAPGFDGAPIFGTLGVVARPWPKDSRGSAQALVEEGIGGQNGIITNIRDLRAAGVVEELGDGETAVIATGPDFLARLFLKDQLWSLMIGPDNAIVNNAKEKKLTISMYGHHVEISEENGIVITASGGATSQWTGAMQSHMGQIVLGGRNPLFPVAQMMVPALAGVAPMSPIVGIAQAPGVFIGV